MVMIKALHTPLETLSPHLIAPLSAEMDATVEIAPGARAPSAYCVFVLRLWHEQPSTGGRARQRLLLESYESLVRYGFGDAAELAAFVDGILARMAPVAEA